MKIACFMSDSAREQRVHKALLAGFKRHGEKVWSINTHMSTTPDPKADLIVFIGVRTKSRAIREACVAAGMPYLMLDKGYFRRDDYHRMSLCSPQPLYLDAMSYTDDRLKRFRVEVREEPPAHSGSDVIYVEATQKYYSFHGLGISGDYAAKVCGKLNDDLKSLSKDGKPFRVIYRPKRPSGKGPLRDIVQPVNTVLSDPTKHNFDTLLPTAHLVVVHGSNAGVEAAIRGVPVLSLGDRTSFALHDLVNGTSNPARLLNPKTPEPYKLRSRLAQMAHCQFSDGEMERGYFWEVTKPLLQHAGKPV